MSNSSQTPIQSPAADDLVPASSELELEDVIAQLVQNQDTEQQVLQELTAEIDLVRCDLTATSDTSSGASDLQRINAQLSQLEEQVADMKASLVARDSLILSRLDKAAAIDANISTLRAGLREALIGFQQAFKLRDEQHSEGLSKLAHVQKEHFDAQLQMMGSRLSEVGSEIARRSNEIVSRGFRTGLDELASQVEQLQQRLDSMKSEADAGAERLVEQFEGATSSVATLLEQSSETAQSAEIIANAFHDLQIDVAAIRQSTARDKNDPFAEQNRQMFNVLYDLQSQMEQVQAQVTAQSRKLEQAEIERQAHEIVPEEKSYGSSLFSGAILLLLLLNAVVGVAVYARLTGTIL